MKRKLFKFINTAKKITHKKHHLDFIVAVLTIPVLLSVIVLNYSNLQKSKTEDIVPTPTESKQQIIVVPKDSTKENSTQAPINPSCTKDIGPISITSPKEKETVTANPVCITIDYSDLSFCSVVWSYRINGGEWSDFNSSNPCIYNLPAGNVKFDLKVQSTVKQKEENLTRSFIYAGTTVSPTLATPSATQ